MFPAPDNFNLANFGPGTNYLDMSSSYRENSLERELDYEDIVDRTGKNSQDKRREAKEKQEKEKKEKKQDDSYAMMEAAAKTSQGKRNKKK